MRICPSPKDDAVELSSLQGWSGTMKKRPEDDLTEANVLEGSVNRGSIAARAGDVNDVMGKIAGRFGRLNPGVVIHLKYQKGVWPIGVRNALIFQILFTLLNNAGQAMPGGGDLYAETANFTIEERRMESFSLRPGRYVKLSVTDTGATQRVFMPFATRHENDGNGEGCTGLDGIDSVVSRHGGVITMVRKEAIGTTFSVYLPASKNPVGV